MRILKLSLPGLILVAGVGFPVGNLDAKPEYTRKEKKGCTFCHVDAKTKPKEMTEAGKFYAEHKTLEGYKP